MTAVDTDVDVVIVGAGFAGLYAIHRLRTDGLRVLCVEGGSDVGGTWFWNRYPGARCDVESLDYSYSFDPDLEQEWDWTERYARQPEIQRYLRHVSERLDLRRDIRFDTWVSSAVLDEDGLVWTVETSAGDRITARFVVLATGPLSVANTPEIPGSETFRGRTFHTGAWPHEEVDLSGRRVAVIGTGSSGIQLIPQVADVAGHLHVLQRTPNFSIPARNFTWEPEKLAEVKAGYRERRARSWAGVAGTPHPPPVVKALDVDPIERRRLFEERWQVGGPRFARVFTDQMSDGDANAEAVAFVHDKIRETVADPAVAEALLPRDHPLGAKRICVDTGYFETYNRPNVTLHDLRTDPIEAIEPAGVRLRGGLVEVDDIVFATGFDAMTGAVARIDVRGRGGRSLREDWSAGPRSLLGIGVTGYPNLFLVNGPNSPSVFVNLVLTSEQQVDWIADAIGHLCRNGLSGLEAQARAQDEWVLHCTDLVAGSLLLQANSWYLGANIPGKPRVFLAYVGGFPRYIAECDAVARDGYRGFDVLGATEAVGAGV